MRQVYIRVYRLEIQSVLLVFSTQLCELLLLFILLSGSTLHTSHLSCVNKYTVYTYTVCNGGYGVLGLKAAKSLYR
jgi:hypothetical protein